MIFGGGILGLLLMVVWVFSILDVIGSDAAVIRNLPKLAWLFVVVLLGPIGSMAWFLLGRPARPTALSLPESRPRPIRRRPSAPPIDPQEELRKQQEASERWAQERERRLREWEEQKRRDEGDPGEAGVGGG